ncbi:MAG: hypothetical protein A2Y28_04390 [Chlamydiae bacterium GWC2_50_10]|nr:MAG: hypothetical protein A2Z85_05000 [Chlamydiae bacterium GWA2_50_15]OGN54977.1 MAG: hypothetical protein A2Y28_04390 [Chlamydiae bacterium GWC2_50_10]OGN55844.1 MAG: hypothetical protein A2098_04455 [Chlamydiae bacterium GWF2_49_8]OGN58695.1 MAG: hypothetical protein A3D18_06295 [Chlamydiae bacterium RIFCSPHIGHO2_02_FULL_49_29]OGN63088.1 MAG: hypothetical protein A3E26_00475 [Chlamydiae bacterium RIFCSPHIGHO2_12_FULL_49_32]OGN68755.1 MAG: hypothetical protein A3I15_04790 [Chlamydiae bact
MPINKELTTEHVRSLFPNTFKLTNYAIRLAQFYIRSGQEVSSSSLVKEVAKHPDESYLETLKSLEEEESETYPEELPSES